MSLLALGINHKTAPLTIREQATFADAQIPQLLQELLDLSSITEAVVLATCNRSELYCAVSDIDQAQQQLFNWLHRHSTLPKETLTEVLYCHTELAAVSHLAQVASGLDSLILGEPQILGQLKHAFTLAQQQQTLGPQLHRLFACCFTIAKQVRTQTDVNRNAISVAYAAAQMSTHIFPNLNQCQALLIGAGDTIERVARHLQDKGVTHILLANRTLAHAQHLAQSLMRPGSQIQVMPLADIGPALAQVDIVIASTASPTLILSRNTIAAAIKARKHRPLFIVDLAVPRDIDPSASTLADVYLYSVDDLQQVVAYNLQQRQQAATGAQELIAQQVRQFAQQQQARQAVDTIKQFRRHIRTLQHAELDKAYKQLENGGNPHDILQRFATTLTNKLMHEPSVQLRQAHAKGDTQASHWLKRIFNL